MNIGVIVQSWLEWRVIVTKPSNKSSLKINYYEHCDLFVKTMYIAL